MLEFSSTVLSAPSPYLIAMLETGYSTYTDTSESHTHTHTSICMVTSPSTNAVFKGNLRVYCHIANSTLDATWLVRILANVPTCHHVPASPTLQHNYTVNTSQTAQWLIDWVVVLRPTRHKTGHFGDVPQANLLARYGKTKNNTTKAHIHQSRNCTTTQNKHRKLKPSLVASSDILTGSRVGFWFQRFINLLLTYLPTYLQPRTHMGLPDSTNSRTSAIHRRNKTRWLLTSAISKWHPRSHYTVCKTI